MTHANAPLNIEGFLEAPQFLERYARPGVDAVAEHVAASDPAARRRG
ncbi:hypothetical protein ACWD4L_43380 [Streptomyces sp. NPDC002596]